MLDIQKFHILIQLVGNMEFSSKKLEEAYRDNDGELFKKARDEMMDIQNKISKITLI